MQFKRFRVLTFSATLIGCSSSVFGAPLDCLITPKSVVNLVASDKGQIVEIAVARGDRVSKGDVLVRLDDSLQRLHVQMAKARMESDVIERSSKVRLARRVKDLERAEKLLERKVATATSVDDAEMEKALTELAVEQAAIDRQLSEIEYAQALALLDRRTILSPSNGIVSAVRASVGEYAHEQLEILTIAEMDPLKVEVFAPISTYAEIEVGQIFDVVQNAPLDGVFQGQIKAIDQVFDAASATFGLQLDLRNPDGSIPAGVRCRIDLLAPLKPL